MSAVYPKKLPKPPLKVQEKVVPSKVKYKKPKQKSILKEIAQGYTAATTLHGFQYLGESGVHLLERYVGIFRVPTLRKMSSDWAG